MTMAGATEKEEISGVQQVGERQRFCRNARMEAGLLSVSEEMKRLQTDIDALLSDYYRSIGEER